VPIADLAGVLLDAPKLLFTLVLVFLPLLLLPLWVRAERKARENDD
jgi:hypothetical protein